MAREPEEEEAAGAAALARGGRGSLRRIGARRPPLWLLCLAAGWLLGAGADADFSILDEAQVLASQMRRLAAEELGVVTMQVRAPLRAHELARYPVCPRAEPGPTPSPGPLVCSPTSLACPEPPFPVHLCPLHGPLTTHQLLLQALGPPSFSPLQKPLPFAPHPLSPPPAQLHDLDRILGFPHTSLANLHELPRRLVLPRHPCKLPFPLCVPIPGQTAPPGSDDLLSP